MAKWGEGDPRWIVEVRPDGTNVNNWHWTERDACQWSQNKIKDLFENLEIKLKAGKVKIKKVDKCEGEASASHRKGKLIFFYEWNITLEWTGEVDDSEDEVKGTINIPNLSEENSLEEIEVVTSIETKSEAATSLKDELYTHGKPVILEKLKIYVSSLKEDFSQGMILPLKENGQTENKDPGENKAPKSDTRLNSAKLSSKNEPVKSDIVQKTSSLSFNLSFVCTGAEFYNALTTRELVSIFTNGPAKLEAVTGGKFELFGGNIHGEFVELIPNKKIVQKWRTKSWKSGHYSTVTIDIDQKSDHTQVIMKQTGVPEAEVENTTANWERYYWEAMKRTLRFGAFL